ncbi:MAG: GntR family transcriptional regulator [Lachnospiraceae bacterium]|nr:GntR family transcriptional regulator [Lachnospiraceae bacterium]
MHAYKDSSKRLLQYITENKMKRGDRFPAETELAEILGISRLTLREAMNALKQEGVISAIQGKGTFVTFDYHYMANFLNLNKSVTEMIEDNGYTCSTSLFQKKLVKAGEDVAEGLDISEDSDVLVCERIRLADDIPVVYSLDYLAPQLASHFLQITDAEVSLYNFVEEKCGIEIGQCMTEIVPVAADEELAGKLEVPLYTPLLKFKVRVQDMYCTPIIYAEECLRTDKFKFIANRRR